MWQVVVVEKGEHAPAESLSLLERESNARLYEGASLLTTADAGALPRSVSHDKRTLRQGTSSTKQTRVCCLPV